MILDLPTVSSVARADGGGLDVASAAPSLSAATSAERSADSCRFCGGALHDFVDLGMSPLCESFLAADQIDAMEPFYPLKVMVCDACFLAQVKEYVTPEHIFPNCPRYIPRLEIVEDSVYLPKAGCAPVEPQWKSFDQFKDVVPPRAR